MFVYFTQFLLARFLLRLQVGYALWLIALKAHILPKLAAFGKLIVLLVTTGFVMLFALVSALSFGRLLTTFTL